MLIPEVTYSSSWKPKQPVFNGCLGADWPGNKLHNDPHVELKWIEYELNQIDIKLISNWQYKCIKNHKKYNKMARLPDSCHWHVIGCPYAVHTNGAVRWLSVDVRQDDCPYHSAALLISLGRTPMCHSWPQRQKSPCADLRQFPHHRLGSDWHWIWSTSSLVGYQVVHTNYSSLGTINPMDHLGCSNSCLLVGPLFSRKALPVVVLSSGFSWYMY